MMILKIVYHQIRSIVNDWVGIWMTEDKQDFVPDSIDELEKLYYGPNKDGYQVDLEKIAKNQDWIYNQMNPSKEEFVQKIFSVLGKIIKIPTTEETTSDFAISEEKLLIEVTSIRIDVIRKSKVIRPQLSLKKLRRSIQHIAEKNDADYQQYNKGGVIISDTITEFFLTFYDWIKNNPPRIKTEIPSNIQFLVFVKYPDSFEESFTKAPPIIYVKKEYLPVLQKIKNFDKCIIIQL